MILFLLKKSYFDESWYTVSLEGGAISLSDRKLSTYINALTKAGFAIEEMIEESDDEIIQLYKDSDFAKKSQNASCNICNQSKEIITIYSNQNS